MVDFKWTYKPTGEGYEDTPVYNKNFEEGSKTCIISKEFLEEMYKKNILIAEPVIVSRLRFRNFDKETWTDYSHGILLRGGNLPLFIWRYHTRASIDGDSIFTHRPARVLPHTWMWAFDVVEVREYQEGYDKKGMLIKNPDLRFIYKLDE